MIPISQKDSNLYSQLAYSFVALLHVFFFQFCVVFDVQQIIFTKRKIEQEHTEKKSWKL